LAAYEGELAAGGGGRFSHGDEIGMADACLVQQIFNAKCLQVSLEPYPCRMAVFDACMALDAVARAQPSAQPEAARAG